MIGLRLLTNNPVPAPARNAPAIERERGTHCNRELACADHDQRNQSDQARTGASATLADQQRRGDGAEALRADQYTGEARLPGVFAGEQRNEDARERQEEPGSSSDEKQRRAHCQVVSASRTPSAASRSMCLRSSSGPGANRGRSESERPAQSRTSAHRRPPQRVPGKGGQDSAERRTDHRHQLGPVLAQRQGPHELIAGHQQPRHRSLRGNI